jgi:hypothetical protein
MMKGTNFFLLELSFLCCYCHVFLNYDIRFLCYSEYCDKEVVNCLNTILFDAEA